MKEGRVVRPEWFEMPHIGYWLIITPAIVYVEVETVLVWSLVAVYPLLGYQPMDTLHMHRMFTKGARRDSLSCCLPLLIRAMSALFKLGIFLQMLYLAPEMLPLTQLGPIGTLGIYMIDQRPGLLQTIFVAMNLAHVLEGAYAFYLCRKLKLNAWAALRWTLQTTIIGFSSLGKLTSKVSQLGKSA